MLRELSVTGEGMYYYVDKEESISLCFADCLGGILSVVCQNISMKIEMLNKCVLKENLTAYKNKKDKGFEIAFEDMTSEEKKDLIFQFEIPALEEEVEDFEVCKITLSYFNIIEMNLETKIAIGKINRPKYLSEKCKSINRIRYSKK